MATLIEHLKNTGQTQAEFAQRIGCSRSFFNEIVNRKRRPGLLLALRIERATGGAVQAASLADVGQSTSPAAASTREVS